MKIFKYHLVKIARIPMFAIASYFFNHARHTLKKSDSDSRLMTDGFEEGYRRALSDLGIKSKHHPKGKRE